MDRILIIGDAVAPTGFARVIRYVSMLKSWERAMLQNSPARNFIDGFLRASRGLTSRVAAKDL